MVVKMKQSEDSVKMCVIQGGKRRCWDIESEVVKGMSLFTKILIALACLFVAVLITVIVLSFLKGALGFDVVAALQLSGIILLLPISVLLALWLGIFIYKNTKLDGTANTLIVIILIIVIAVGLYFLWAWAIDMIFTLWGDMVASW